MLPFNLKDYTKTSLLITRDGHVAIIKSIDLDKTLPLEIYKLTLVEFFEHESRLNNYQKVYRTYRVLKNGMFKIRVTTPDDLFFKQETDRYV